MSTSEPAVQLKNQFCFLIARPRSGTTVFRKMLQTHPRIFSVGEIFNESNPNSYFRYLQTLVPAEADAFFPSKSLENFLRYLEWTRQLSAERRPKAKLVVLDVKYDQSHLLSEPWWGFSSLPRIFPLIREHRWRVIDVRRKDIRAMIISNAVAIETKVYHSTALEQDQRQHMKVHIDKAQLLRQIETTEGSYRRISRHFDGYERYMAVNYEEMFDQEGGGAFSPAMLNGLSAFLNVENRFDAQPKLSKVLVGDMFEYVENAAEIKEAIRDQEEINCASAPIS